MVCGKGGAACSACASDKYCSGSGACDLKTWCHSQAIPTGVSPQDYQCVDFDIGMPPSNVWVPTLQGPGCRLELATDQVQSVPNSLYALSFPTDATDPAPPQPIADLRWTMSGGVVSAVSVITDIYPVQRQGAGLTKADYVCVQ